MACIVGAYLNRLVGSGTELSMNSERGLVIRAWVLAPIGAGDVRESESREHT